MPRTRTSAQSKKKPAASTSTTLAKRLAAYYTQSGWGQSKPDSKERRKNPNTYKRGYEIRMGVPKADLPKLRRLLKQAGFVPGAPFAKVNRVVQPIYGKEQVERFMALMRKAGR